STAGARRSSLLRWLSGPATEAAEAAADARMPQLVQGLRLDLAHALAGNAHLLPDLLQGIDVAVAQPEAQLQHQALAWRQRLLQDAACLVLEDMLVGALVRRLVFLVDEEIAQLPLLLFADRRLKGDRRARGFERLMHLLGARA